MSHVSGGPFHFRYLLMLLCIGESTMPHWLNLSTDDEGVVMVISKSVANLLWPVWDAEEGVESVLPFGMGWCIRVHLDAYWSGTESAKTSMIIWGFGGLLPILSMHYITCSFLASSFRLRLLHVNIISGLIHDDFEATIFFIVCQKLYEQTVPVQNHIKALQKIKHGPRWCYVRLTDFLLSCGWNNSTEKIPPFFLIWTTTTQPWFRLLGIPDFGNLGSSNPRTDGIWLHTCCRMMNSIGIYPLPFV